MPPEANKQTKKKKENTVSHKSKSDQNLTRENSELNYLISLQYKSLIAKS